MGYVEKERREWLRIEDGGVKVLKEWKDWRIEGRLEKGGLRREGSGIFD